MKHYRIKNVKNGCEKWHATTESLKKGNWYIINGETYEVIYKA